MHFMRKENLTSIFVIAALAAEAAACDTTYTSPVKNFETANTPKTFVPTEVPTFAPTLPPTLEATATQTQIPEWQKPLDQRFILGSFDPSKTGYILELPRETLSTMFFMDSTKDFEANPALRINTPYLPIDIMNAFVESADKDGGKTPIVFLTDLSNILMLYAHSESLNAPGEAARIIASFVLKNPDKANEIIGKQVIFKTKGKDINSTIAFVKAFNAEQFDDNTSSNRLWGIYPEKDNIIFFLTDAAGIPDSIRNDKTHKYIILVSCLPKDGDPINLNPFDPNRVDFNTAERAVVVLQLDNP